MAIYRGVGGAGDATGDAASEAVLALAAAAEASASAASASSSATAAANSATAADSSADAAATSASNASGSASAAETAETNAASSASDAADSATAAASSASSASSSASAASTSASNASSSASSASTSATNAASSASSASTSATNASSSASSASTSASTATTQATNASNSASAASTSATNAAASETAAASSASAAATSATNAASSASTASTQATNASNSASSASTSATNAASSASSASTSASTASTQATNAASSATAAASSASAAASSAASAAASLDSFDDRYLGSKTSDPTVDNDGNALVTGALYYNSTDGEMRVYDGSQWIAASAASQAILTKYKYVATAGQTSFSGSDANALTLAYTVGSIIVTLNGVTLSASDYTATTGTSVVLGTAASLNDEVNIFSFSTFDVANTYTQAQADAKFVELAGDTMTGDLRLNNGNADGAQLQLASSGYSDWNLDNYSGRLRAYYGSTEYFTVNASGNVGIGTTSLNGTNSSRSLCINGATDAAYEIKSNGTLCGVFYHDGTILTAKNVVSGAFAFGTNNTERMRIDSSGNVGIGTSSPSVRLSVQGATADTCTLQLKQTDTGGHDWRISSRNAGQLQFNDDTAGAERMRIDSSGSLLIGTTTSGLHNSNSVVAISYNGSVVGQIVCNHASGTGSGERFAKFGYNGGEIGNISQSGTTAVSYNTTSDYRLKENVQPLSGALARITALKPCTYTWKAAPEEIGEGFIAHELAEVCPHAVTGEKDAVNEDGTPKYQGIDTSFLVATLTAAIQELKAELDAAKADIAALKGQ